METLLAASHILILIGGIEFYCAQVPYILYERFDGWHYLWFARSVYDVFSSDISKSNHYDGEQEH